MNSDCLIKVRFRTHRLRLMPDEGWRPVTLGADHVSSPRRSVPVATITYEGSGVACRGRDRPRLSQGHLTGQTAEARAKADKERRDEAIGFGHIGRDDSRPVLS
jgi:hypothetical protein